LFFYWKDGPLGRLWVSKKGLQDVVERFLPEKSRCAELFFDGERSLLTLSIELQGDLLEEDAKRIERDLACEFSSIGIEKVVLNVVKTEDAKGVEALLANRLCGRFGMDKPVFWAVLAGAVSAAFQLGLRGILCALGWSVAGFLVSFFLLSDEGKKVTSKIMSFFKRDK
jgi:hypothetical protein